MSQLLVYQVDAFTREAFKGNPAGVVPNAHGLSAEAMQAIAREMNNSETAFVFPGDGPFDDVSVRFFTPSTEVPICGHATIAAHYILALEGLPLGKRWQTTRAGRLLVESEIAEGQPRIWMSQQPATFERPLADPDLADLLAALRLSPSDIVADTPVQVVSTGHSKVVIPVRRRETIAALAPDMVALTRLSAKIGCNGYFPFTLDSPDPGNLSHGRMFAPAIGISEDPVTGNASGCLGAYLVHHGLVAPDADRVARFVAGQGAEVGRPGRVFVEAARQLPSAPIQIRIAGDAVVTLKGSLALHES